MKASLIHPFVYFMLYISFCIPGEWGYIRLNIPFAIDKVEMDTLLLMMRKSLISRASAAYKQVTGNRHWFQFLFTSSFIFLDNNASCGGLLELWRRPGLWLISPFYHRGIVLTTKWKNILPQMLKY